MITIIDLGISNIKSIARGFITQGFQVKVTTDPGVVRKAASLVLPGVGAFPKAVEVLKGMGLWGVIKEHAMGGKPLIGICLGMQLLFTDSDEHTLTEGLNLIPGHVRRFPPDRPIPHMGWNEVVIHRDSPLFRGISGMPSIPGMPSIHGMTRVPGAPKILHRADFYFVHSYYGEPDDPTWEVGTSDYHGRFTAAVQRDNVFGTQFHPEKSQDHGLMVLSNFALLTEN